MQPSNFWMEFSYVILLTVNQFSAPTSHIKVLSVEEKKKQSAI